MNTADISILTLVIIYWLASGALCAALYFFINRSDEEAAQWGSRQTPATRLLHYFVFGGALLPFTFLMALAAVPAALVGRLAENRNQLKRIARPSQEIQT